MVGSMFKGEDTDADPSPSPSSSLSSGTSVSSIDRVRQSLTDSRLLSKVLRLANPGKVNSEGEGPKVSGVAFLSPTVGVTTVYWSPFLINEYMYIVQYWCCESGNLL